MKDSWHFFDADTGAYRGASYTGPEKHLADNTPPGCVAVRGIAGAAFRLDLATKILVPASGPLPEHPVDRRQRLLAEVRELEVRQQRPMRELALDPADVQAMARLRELERLIVERRAQLAEPLTAGIGKQSQLSEK